MQDKNAKEIWLRIFLDRTYLDRHGISQTELLTNGKLEPDFRVVDSAGSGENQLCIEQVNAIKYNHRATDEVMKLVDIIRPRLWCIVSAVPGGSYRRYYLCLTDPGHVRAPQIASLWVLLFYLGSIVRYRPHLFDEVTNGSYGAFVDEFVASQPHQLLYLLASEMCQREIAKPAIV